MTAFELYRYCKRYGIEHDELFVTHKGNAASMYGETISIAYVDPDYNFEDKKLGSFVLIPLEERM